MDEPTPTRRTFLRHCRKWAPIAFVGAGAYGVWEASSIRVTRTDVPLPKLPKAFAGKTIAVLGDFHHGPFVGVRFLREAVRLANSLRPDAVALVGDFAFVGRMADARIGPCLEALAELEAPLGVFAVPGNHDKPSFGDDRAYREAVAATSITDLTNRSVRLTSGGESLWMAGVDDLWTGRPSLPEALAGVPEGAAVVLLSHNPDFTEDVRDIRVRLVLSGHTHGGQVCLPLVGAPWAPTRYGSKYLRGLVQGPSAKVFVTRGLGESVVPVRLNSPPEMNLLTLVPEGQREAA